MIHYLLLANPGHNRIYFESAQQIGRSELQAIALSANAQLSFVEDSRDEYVHGLPANLQFSVDAPLTPEQMQRLSSASTFYSLFEIKLDKLLQPCQVQDFRTFPESMVQILRYTGKTNEQFTRLMVNLAVSASETRSERLTLLDPMSGKGTSLYEGLIRGYNVVGVEINSKWVEETRAYLLNFMKKGRYKHGARKERRNLAGGNKKAATGFILDCAHSKAAYANKQSQQLQLFDGDTRQLQHMVKKRSCDVLVCDLPYGVQHGSKNAKDSKLERSPLELLEQALPSWSQALKAKAAAVISFNEFTLTWQQAATAFTQAGFEVLPQEYYQGYLHRVDQSIKRNLIVARKK
ncbi:TRM11 family SAM-dependent methyltransferase [Paraferrimonas haliotis]|uniref:DNA methylase n=1 Tax=Paraferrimonas haliotis TaxID=2013866 RepID=A0AA37TVH1_9GAMM|nr:DNA methylase [Paraferrimonas haliotis]GLS83664.1 DNA methylase [Paraferrimonas haliotis]